MDLEMGPKTDQKWAQKIYLIFIKFLSKFKIIFLFFEPNFPIGSRTSFGVVRPLTKKSHLILIWTWDALFKLWCGSSWLFCYNRHAIDLFPLRLFLRSLDNILNGLPHFHRGAPFIWKVSIQSATKLTGLRSQKSLILNAYAKAVARGPDDLVG